MGDGFRKVRTGEPLRVPARAYNAFVDAALAHRRESQRIGREPERALGDRGVALVRNESGGAIDRFGALGVAGPLVDPGDNEREFAERVALRGVTPGVASHRGRFVLTLEPLAAGAVGRALVVGVCPALVDAPEDETPRYADIDDGETGHLLGGESGAAAVLWIEEGEGPRWALVRLGGEAGAVIPVTLTLAGGDAGDEMGPATFVYDAADARSGAVLLEGADPVAPPHQWRRPNVGAMTAATFGYAHRDADGALALGWINETPVQEACGEVESPEALAAPEGDCGCGKAKGLF